MIIILHVFIMAECKFSPKSTCNAIFRFTVIGKLWRNVKRLKERERERGSGRESVFYHVINRMQKIATFWENSGKNAFGKIENRWITEQHPSQIEFSDNFPFIPFTLHPQSTEKKSPWFLHKCLSMKNAFPSNICQASSSILWHPSIASFSLPFEIRINVKWREEKRRVFRWRRRMRYISRVWDVKGMKSRENRSS